MTREWGPTVLRTVVGLAFLAHGAPKLLALAGAAPAVVMAGSIVPGGWPAAVIGLVEAAAGAALLAGAYTTWAAAVLGVDRLAVAWILRRPSGYFLNWDQAVGTGHGYEYDLLLLAALVCLILTGPGALSWDDRRARSAEAAALGRARLRSR